MYERGHMTYLFRPRVSFAAFGRRIVDNIVVDLKVLWARFQDGAREAFTKAILLG